MDKLENDIRLARHLVSLADVAAIAPFSFVDGPFGSNLKSFEYREKGIRLIQLQNIGEGEWLDSNKKFISPEKFEKLSKHGALPGDIAIAKMAEPVARACLLPKHISKYIVVADCIKLSPDTSKYCPKFLVFSINGKSIREQAESLSVGSTRKRINLSKLKSIQFWVPPLPEQRQIAEVLDTVDEAIRKTEQIIEKLKKVKDGLLHDLLTRGVDENGNLRDPERNPELFKDSPLGQIPKDWEVCKIGDAADSYSGGTPSRNVTYFYDGSIPWVKSGEVNQNEIADTEEMISESAFRSSSVKWVEKDSTLIAMYGATAGQVSWLKIRATTNQAVLALVPKLEVSGRWLFWTLKYFAPRLISSVQGSGQPNLSKGIIDDCVFSLPTKKEQGMICEILDDFAGRLALELSKLHKLRKLKQGLMEDLLSGKVSTKYMRAVA